MQLWETLIWKDYNCTLFTKLAFISNVMQPVMLPLMFFFIYPEYVKENKEKFYLVSFVLVLYFLFIREYFTKDYDCIRHNDGLHFKWWGKYGGKVYFITMLLSFFILLKKQLAIFQSLVFTLSIFISYQLNESKPLNTAGRIGSIWCWIASFIPIINYLYFIRN